MNPALLMPDETPTRLDKLGNAFMEDHSSITNDEAFELLADLFDVHEKELADHFNGGEFVTEKYAKARKNEVQDNE